jgi:DNA recombination protein RmuC
MEIVIYILVGLGAFAAGYFLAQARQGQATQAQLTAAAVAQAALEAETSQLRQQVATQVQEAAGLSKTLEEQRALLRSREQELMGRLSQAEAQLEATRQLLHQQQTVIAESRQQWENDFKVLSDRVLKAQTEEFRTTSIGQLEQTLKPLRDRLLEFNAKVESTQLEQVKYQSALQEQIKQLTTLNQEVGSEARNLAKALKGDKKTQGNWGEGVLERLLEHSGLQKDIHYRTQVHAKGEEGNRNYIDVVVYLPGDKAIVIDAKTSLVDYEAYFATEDEIQRAAALKRYQQAVRNHIDELARRSYHHLPDIPANPDMTLMFVPIEGAFMLAVTQDPGLFEYAIRKKVALVSGASLLATLSTVYYIWNQEKLQQNALDIAERAGKLYDKLAAFLEDMIKVGQRLKDAQTTYEAAMNKLSVGSGNAIGQVEKLRKLGAKATKQIDLRILERATAHAPELGDGADETD